MYLGDQDAIKNFSLTAKQEPKEMISKKTDTGHRAAQARPPMATHPPSDECQCFKRCRARQRSISPER
jgi:hypothetical protein